MKRNYWLGIILILIGLLLLMDETEIMSLEWFDILFYAFVVMGIMMFSKGMGRSDKNGILGGTFFISFGILMLLISNRILMTDDEFVFAILFLCLSLSNLVYFIFRSSRWFNLAWTAIFGALGSLLLISYYGYYPSWYIYEIIETYWPVAIILIGLTLLLRGLRKPNAVT